MSNDSGINRFNSELRERLRKQRAAELGDNDVVASYREDNDYTRSNGRLKILLPKNEMAYEFYSGDIDGLYSYVRRKKGEDLSSGSYRDIFREKTIERNVYSNQEDRDIDYRKQSNSGFSDYRDYIDDTLKLDNKYANVLYGIISGRGGNALSLSPDGSSVGVISNVTLNNTLGGQIISEVFGGQTKRGDFALKAAAISMANSLIDRIQRRYANVGLDWLKSKLTFWNKDDDKELDFSDKSISVPSKLSTLDSIGKSLGDNKVGNFVSQMANNATLTSIMSELGELSGIYNSATDRDVLNPESSIFDVDLYHISRSDEIIPNLEVFLNKNNPDNENIIANEFNKGIYKTKARNESLIRNTGKMTANFIYSHLNRNKFSPAYSTEKAFKSRNYQLQSAYLGITDDSIDFGYANLTSRRISSVVDNTAVEGIVNNHNRNWLDQQKGGDREKNLGSEINESYNGQGQTFGVITQDFLSSHRIADQPEGQTLLEKTSKLFASGKIRTMTSSYCDPSAKFSDIQTSMTRYGMSKGRNLLKKDPDAQDEDEKKWKYRDPYCRVWTHHKQYMKMSNLIRPFVDTDDNGVSSFSNSQLSSALESIRPGGRLLETYSVLNPNNTVKIAPNTGDGDRSVLFDFSNNRSQKRYMFSIENLAWKDLKLDRNLTDSQIGPNGGRIMWFAPYGLTFNENTNAHWNTQNFIGRSEPVYTYANSERSGNLSFKLIVDYPSIIDKQDKASMSKDEAEQELLRFFAGCGMITVPAIPPEPTPPPPPPAPAPPLVYEMSDIISIAKVYFPNDYSGRGESSPMDAVEYLYFGRGRFVSKTEATIKKGVLPIEDESKKHERDALLQMYNDWMNEEINIITGLYNVIVDYLRDEGYEMDNISGLVRLENNILYIIPSVHTGTFSEERFNNVVEDFDNLCNTIYEYIETEEDKTNIIYPTLLEQGNKPSSIYYVENDWWQIVNMSVAIQSLQDLIDKTSQSDINKYDSPKDEFDQLKKDIAQFMNTYKTILDNHVKSGVDKDKAIVYDVEKNIISFSYKDIVNTIDWQKVDGIEDIFNSLCDKCDNLSERYSKYKVNIVYPTRSKDEVGKIRQIRNSSSGNVVDVIIDCGDSLSSIDTAALNVPEEYGEEEFNTFVPVDSCGYEGGDVVSSDGVSRNYSLGLVCKESGSESYDDLLILDGDNEITSDVVENFNFSSYNMKHNSRFDALLKKYPNIINNMHRTDKFKFYKDAKLMIPRNYKTDELPRKRYMPKINYLDIANTGLNARPGQQSGKDPQKTCRYSFRELYELLTLGYDTSLDGKRTIEDLKNDLKNTIIKVTGGASQVGYDNDNVRLAKYRSNVILQWLKESIRERFTNLGYEFADFDTQGELSENTLRLKFQDEAENSSKDNLIAVDKCQTNNSIGNDNSDDCNKKGRFAEIYFEVYSIVSEVQTQQDTEVDGNVDSNNVNSEELQKQEAEKQRQEAIEKIKSDENMDIKKGKMMYDDESSLFEKQLKVYDDFYYANIRDKFDQFIPSFHSTTPEGFNARLTFLQQCVRQGPTSVSQSGDTSIAGNLAFGRQPVCVLRLGDFFNTKIIIKNVQINYGRSSVRWDLNPEGVGVQPMEADITLSISLIGGSDITGPIQRLQNAVSFNYYANTSVYDDRADSHKNILSSDMTSEDSANIIEALGGDVPDFSKVGYNKMYDPNTYESYEHRRKESQEKK